MEAKQSHTFSHASSRAWLPPKNLPIEVVLFPQTKTAGVNYVIQNVGDNITDCKCRTNAHCTQFNTLVTYCGSTAGQMAQEWHRSIWRIYWSM
jgi:hypothetical protein